MKTSKITGLKNVLKKLDRTVFKLSGRIEDNLKLGGLEIQRASQKIVPVDLGILKPSAFTRSDGKGFKTQVTIGYTTSYAIYVHENLDAKHETGKKAKFLEDRAKELAPQILKMINDVKM